MFFINRLTNTKQLFVHRTFYYLIFFEEESSLGMSQTDEWIQFKMSSVDVCYVLSEGLKNLQKKFFFF